VPDYLYDGRVLNSGEVLPPLCEELLYDNLSSCSVECWRDKAAGFVEAEVEDWDRGYEKVGLRADKEVGEPDELEAPIDCRQVNFDDHFLREDSKERNRGWDLEDMLVDLNFGELYRDSEKQQQLLTALGLGWWTGRGH
jgi:hypothetical protein